MDKCACAPDCPARCVPERLCDNEHCPCYQMWSVEFDAFAEAFTGLSPEIIHRMAMDAWRRG